MGEYVIHGTETVKLGTCEDLMYVRRAELESLVYSLRRAEGNLDPRDYLKAEFKWFYRFPDPSEDPKPEDWNSSPWARDPEPAHLKYRICALPAKYDTPETHDGKTVSLSANGSYNVNVKVECPATLRSKPSSVNGSWRFSPIPASTPVIPVRERIAADGSLYTVFACGWCGSWFSLESVEALEGAQAEFLRERGLLKARVVEVETKST